MMNLGPWTLRETISGTVSIESAPILRFDGSRSGKFRYRVAAVKDGVTWHGSQWPALHQARSVALRVAGQAPEVALPHIHEEA